MLSPDHVQHPHWRMFMIQNNAYRVFSTLSPAIRYVLALRDDVFIRCSLFEEQIHK